MTFIKKRFLILFVALFSIVSLIFGATFLKTDSKAIASTENTNEDNYFYNNLTTEDSKGNKVQYTLAKKFYEI